MLEFLKIIYGISNEKMWEYTDRKHTEKWKPRIDKLRAEKAAEEKNGCEN
jgi:hypothetical protein